MSRIRLRSGREFDFADPDSTPLLFVDIGRALAREFRYSNQTPTPITVAQHSVMAAKHEFVPEKHRLGMLFHDASEAVMRDIAAPLKAMLPDYQALEEKVQSSILKGLAITPAPKDLIKEVDEALLELEKKMVFSFLLPCDKIWDEKKAWNEFKACYHELR